MSLLREFSNSPIKANSIIGTKVVDPKGNDMGEIKELVIDPRTGKIAYTVVAFGGFLTLGEKLFAIPFSAFEFIVTKSDPSLSKSIQNEYVLNISKEQLQKAPGFDSDHWPLMSDEKWHRSLHSYYQSTPYWE